ncbi:alpha-(1,3)-fucosyltransferase C-like [Oratosquilla oratoria]|uniref:alpha-(1,3)-fucosyltransferase C-like n=1 Tax=Oratosquilla oratoria TaxID=337810 RepID=UPI003F75FC90
MFYLAFENNICWDYATEKIYRAMKHSSIPVVFGGANYSDIIPPDSYISALDFLNPKDLADYLKKVASSSELFNSFHRWKTLFTVEVGQPFSTLTCDLCAQLQGQTEDIEFPSKPMVRPGGQVVARIAGSYPSFNEWFIDESRCAYWDRKTKTLKPGVTSRRNGK